MAVDLMLIPLRGPEQMGHVDVFEIDRLRFDGDSRIFSQLADLGEGKRPTIKTERIPPQMWLTMNGEGGLNKTREDAYGDGLTFVYAQQLRKLHLPDDTSTKNKAVMAFVAALPNDTPIVLFWS